MNAGEFRWRVNFLEYFKTSKNAFVWLPIETLWAKIEYQPYKVVFANNGNIARSAKITIQTCPDITLHNALAVPGGDFFFLTDINRDTPGFDVITVAIVDPVQCKLERIETNKGVNNRPSVSKLPTLTFTGFLTEKYLRQTQNEPMSYSETRYILVTPKTIEIQTGDIVNIGGVKYEMVIPHTLDQYKNEYEILRRSDN